MIGRQRAAEDGLVHQRLAGLGRLLLAQYPPACSYGRRRGMPNSCCRTQATLMRGSATACQPQPFKVLALDVSRNILLSAGNYYTLAEGGANCMQDEELLGFSVP